MTDICYKVSLYEIYACNCLRINKYHHYITQQYHRRVNVRSRPTFTCYFPIG